MVTLTPENVIKEKNNYVNEKSNNNTINDGIYFSIVSDLENDKFKK